MNLPLCEFIFENLEDVDEEIYPVTLKNPRTGLQAGTIFFKLNYKPIDEKLVNPAWKGYLKEASKLDNKYEYFNDHLQNEFKDDCQFGYLSLELETLSIPLMSNNYKKKTNQVQLGANQQLNEIFMVKLKIGAETNLIYVAAPDRILDVIHQKMTANIDSINDKVYLEFYDVLNEEAFDAKKSKDRTDLSNLKLLSYKVFDVRDLPFDQLGVARSFRVLMPVAASGNVASFTFNAMFQKNVPPEYVERPLEQQQRYLLFLKMI